MPGSRSLLGGRGYVQVVGTQGVSTQWWLLRGLNTQEVGIQGYVYVVGTQGWVLRRVEYQGGYLGGEYLGVGTQA